MEKVCAKLSQWARVLPQLSYKGRLLAINNLITSMVWCQLTVHEPPETLIREAQKRIVNFFLYWTTLDLCLSFPSATAGGGSGPDHPVL